MLEESLKKPEQKDRRNKKLAITNLDMPTHRGKLGISRQQDDYTSSELWPSRVEQSPRTQRDSLALSYRKAAIERADRNCSMAHDWKATTGYAHSVASTFVQEHKKSGIEVQRRRD